MSDFDSKVRNCLIKPKPDQDGDMFFIDDNGVRCNLVGYAIIPKAEYEELTETADEIERLTAENERLRDAAKFILKEIKFHDSAQLQLVKSILRNALEATDDT